MRKIRMRPTVYDNHFMQTESYGSHSLELPLASMFDQSLKKNVAAGVEQLVVRAVNQQTKIDALLIELELTVEHFSHVKQIGALLPSLPALNQKASTLDSIAEFIADLAKKQGLWRNRFDKKAAVIINKHVENLSTRCQRFAATAANQFGFKTSTTGLSALAHSLQLESEKSSTDIWTPVDTKSANETAECLKLAGQDVNASWLTRFIFLRRFPKEEWAYVEQLYELAKKLVAKRRQQLLNEAVRIVIRRMLDENEEGSIPFFIKRYTEYSQNLLSLASSIRDSVMLPCDTVTSTMIVKEVDQSLAGEQTTLFAEFESAFKLAGCSKERIAGFLSEGFQLNGNEVSPTKLASMPSASATQIVVEAVAPMFEPALEFVKKIDLTLPQLQLTIANLAHSWIQKSQPYLKFPRSGSAEENRENYLFCNDSMRSTIEDYCQGRIHFSNHGDDPRYSIASTHVITLMCTVLGAGHGRRNYMRGLYCRSELKGRGEFLSLFENNPGHARPLAISHRPECMADCEQLFEVALELGFVISRGSTGDSLYICNPLDATIYRRFSRRQYRRRPIAKSYLRSLISQQWFVSYAAGVILDLSVDWNVEFLQKSSELSDQQLADRLVELNVLQKVGGQYIFGIQYAPGMPIQDFLFFQRRGKAQGLTRDSFMNAMYQHDDLYTRILVDVVLAMAEGRIEFHRIPKFAQRVALHWRD